jgi:GT2 family glycosyltransferase
MGMVQHYPAVNRPAVPVCSVCIANYNGVALLPDCLDSVLAQQGDFSIEIIVHDDASTDDSVAFLRNLYPQVEVLSSLENVGFCVSNNRMADHARGDYVLLLNNDAALFPDALSTLINDARAQTKPGILTLPQYDWITGLLVDRGCQLDPFYNPIPNLDATRRNVATVIGACLFLSRSLWRQLGGFPEWIESIAEDLYLCCQARLRGAPVQVTATSGYRHRQGASFGGNRVASGKLQTTYRRRALSEKNKTFVLFIMTPGPIMWPLLAVHLILLAIEGMALSILKADTKIWKIIYGPAIAASLCSWTRIRAHRTSEQNVRQIGICQYWSTTRFLSRKLSLLHQHGLPGVK